MTIKQTHTMKKFLAPLLLSASLLSPMEVEAKPTFVESPQASTSVEFVSSTQKASLPSVFAQVNSTSDSDEFSEDDFAAGLAVLGIFVLFLYFIPSGIAILRGHSLAAATVVVNLFLGWTFIGWVVAFVMSVLPNEKNQQVIVQQSTAPGQPNVVTQPGGIEKVKY